MIRKAPAIIAGIFIAITLVRVAEYAAASLHAGWLGWVFSAALGCAVFVSAYYTREHIRRQEGKAQDVRDKNVRRAALVALVLFVVVDGSLNLAHVLLQADTSRWYFALSAWAYGLIPTVGAGVFGWLQGYVDKLPLPPHKPGLSAALSGRIAKMIEQPATNSETSEQPAKPEPKPAGFECQHCGAWFASRNACNAHSGRCKRKKQAVAGTNGNGHNKVERVG